MSNPLLIKICGVKNASIVEETIKAGADMIGFVHFIKSPRHLELSEIKQLTNIARGRIKTVILLVNPTDEILETISLFKADYIQLHGNENIGRIVEIKQKYGLKIIKALPIGSSDDIKKIADYHRIADLLLLDAKPEGETNISGGLGKVFDWRLLDNIDKNINYMLAGGINIDNVKEAISLLRPYGIDVSSGVEIERGKKDKNLIWGFIKKARQAAAIIDK